MEWSITIRATGNPADAQTRIAGFLDTLTTAGHTINGANFSQQGTEDLAAPIVAARQAAALEAEAIKA